MTSVLDPNHPALAPGAIDVPPGDAPDPITELVESTMQFIRLAKAKDFFSGSGLSRMQVGILKYLHHRSPRRLTSLADLLCGDLSVVSRQVNALYESGMIDRTRDPQDGRAWLISLTDAGAEALAQIWAQRRQWFERVLADIDPAELAHVTAVMRMIVDAWDYEVRNPQEAARQPGRATQTSPP